MKKIDLFKDATVISVAEQRMLMGGAFSDSGDFGDSNHSDHGNSIHSDHGNSTHSDRGDSAYGDIGNSNREDIKETTASIPG